MGVNSLPKTVTRQRRGCDLNPYPSAPESSKLTTRIRSHPFTGKLFAAMHACYEARKKARSAKSRREFETVDNSGDYFLRFSSFSAKLVGATSSGGFLVLRGIKELNQFHAIVFDVVRSRA